MGARAAAVGSCAKALASPREALSPQQCFHAFRAHTYSFEGATIAHTASQLRSLSHLSITFARPSYFSLQMAQMAFLRSNFDRYDVCEHIAAVATAAHFAISAEIAAEGANMEENKAENKVRGVLLTLFTLSKLALTVRFRRKPCCSMSRNARLTTRIMASKRRFAG